MKISKRTRKNCLGCLCDQYEFTCEIGYDIKHVPMIEGDRRGCYMAVPKEPCPKPRNRDDWFIARRDMRKQ